MDHPSAALCVVAVGKGLGCRGAPRSTGKHIKAHSAIRDSVHASPVAAAGGQCIPGNAGPRGLISSNEATQDYTAPVLQR